MTSTRAFVGIDKASPTYFLEMKLTDAAAKYDALVGIFQDVKASAVWNPEWRKVEQLGSVVNQSMILLDVNDKDTLKRFCFTSGNKFHVYFSSVPDESVDRLVRRSSSTSQDDFSINQTYEMWRFEKAGKDVNVRRLSQVNFGQYENWQTHEHYFEMELQKCEHIRQTLK